MPLQGHVFNSADIDPDMRPPSFKELGDQAVAGVQQRAASAREAAHNLVGDSLTAIKENVVAPAFNAGLIEPYNTAVGGVNALGGLVGYDQLLHRQGPMTVAQADFLSAGWLVQGVAGGLGALLPYVVAGKAAGSAMRGAGARLELEGGVAKLAQSNRLASVVGASAYDLVRDKKDGETHLGNGAAGAASFTVFEAGNALAGHLGLPGKLLARTATGFLGGGVQALTSEAVSRGQLVGKEDLAHAAISGMVMAHALPASQRAIAGAADHINLRLGRGISIDRAVDGPFAEGKTSPAFNQLVEAHPWARVQLNAPESLAVGTRRVELQAGAAAAELGHELEHLSQSKQTHYEAAFEKAQQLLAAGKTEAAWQTYKETRLSQELAARSSEAQIRTQIAERSEAKAHAGMKNMTDIGQGKERAETPGAQAKTDNETLTDIGQQKVGREGRGHTYEQHWAREFALFQQSNGSFRPTVNFHGGHDAQLLQSHATDHEHLIRESEYQRQLATELVRALQNKNHIAVFAGGSVRDEIMGKLPKDYDIATSASPDQVERLFQQMGHRVIPVGKAFGVINVVVDGREFEIATLRTDGKYIDGRRPESVQFVGSLVEDAARRDLTINAMFKDPISGQIYDYFGGRSDIANGIIRAVGNPRERFAEDNLRMMRIPRFAARYSGFSVDPDTMAAIKSHSVSISGVSGERIREELRGILTAAEPVRGMQIMMNSGLMKEVLPEVYRLRGPKGRQDPDHHPEKTVWTHTKLVLNNLRGGSFERMMGGLLHDVGKPDTQKFWPDGGISNHGHDARGAEITQEIAGRLRLSSQQQGQIVDLVRLHMMMHEVQNLRPAKLTGLLERADVMDLIELQHADAHGTYAARPERSQKEFLLAKLDELKQQGKLGAKPIVDGRALLAMNLKPGPNFRLILDAARDAQREGEFSDSPGAERWLRENVNTIIEQSEREAHGK